MNLRHRVFTFTMTLTCASLLALSSLNAVENPDRVPLSAIEYDTIWLTNDSSIPGTIVGSQPDGALRFDRVGKPTTLIPKSEIVRVERHQSLAEAVSRRGEQALAANDWIDVQRTLRFAAERPPEIAVDPVIVPDPKNDPPVKDPVDPKNTKLEPKPITKKPPSDLGVKDAAIALAQKALAKKASPEIAGLAVQLLTEKKDLDGVLGAAQAGITADPNWTPGYEAQARIFIERKQDERMKALVKVWLTRQPTAREPNRYMARFAESSGDLRTATEAYRKGFDLHQDWESALGYARCSLKRGERDECIRAAKALIDNNQFVSAAKIWLGSALLKAAASEPDAKATSQQATGQQATGQQATSQQATVLLSAGLTDPKLDPETADVGRYNLGVLHERAGQDDEARKLWSQVSGPLGAVALGHLGHKAINADGLPPSMKSFVAEHNAAVELENGTWQNVAGTFDKTASRRAVFLGQVANLLKNAGADEWIHNLAATPGDESLRWQAYGLMKQSRFKDAEALMDKLPVTDGWAIACRVYMASARKDDAGARSWLLRLDGASNVPKKYALELLAEFSSANDEVTTENFDNWPAGGPVATGWEVAAPGTNIVAVARNQALVLEGTQAGSEPTSAYRLVLASRMRSATVKLNLSEMKDSAIGGLELTDEKRGNGLQVGITSSGKVQWRAAEKSTWGPWMAADLAASGKDVALRIELAKGILYVALAGNPGDRKPVSASLGRSERLAVGVFGVADAGTAWSLTADDLEIQLTPTTRP